MMQWIVSSSVLIAGVIALRYLLRGRISLRMQYALWLLVLVRLLIPVNFGASALSVLNALPDTTPAQSEVQVAEKPLQSDMENTFTESPAQDFFELPAAPSTPNGAFDIAPLTLEPAGEAAHFLSAKAIWLVGAAALGLYFLAVNLHFYKVLRRTRVRIEAADARLPIYRTECVETPCLFGLTTPAVYLTPLSCADAETLRYAIAHEQTHYRHGDHIWSVLRGVCLALHWYNPLVWWAAELSRRDAELACDEATVHLLGEQERAAYGRTLIRLTCEKRPALLVTATTMTDNGDGLRERITLLVKKPKTAAYAAFAILLAAAMAIACTFTGKTAELAEPFGKTYHAEGLTYISPTFDHTFTNDTMPSVRFETTGVTFAADVEYAYGAPMELTLTAKNFDAYFADAEDGIRDWLEEADAKNLRKQNANAWSCLAQNPVDGQPNLLLFLQQKGGTCYLVLGYDIAPCEEFPDGYHLVCSILRLGASADDTALETWGSMEAYVLSRIRALKDSYSYYILPAENNADGLPVEVTEPAEDVRVVTLKCEAVCEDLCPDGTLELWRFEYEVKPTDAAGALPERFLWVGGSNLTDDGYISDGYFEYLTVLHRTDGNYQILRDVTSNGGLQYNGSIYENGSDYLYDFYVDYAGLEALGQQNASGYRRYDGEGWYLNIPQSGWVHTASSGAERWDSAADTDSSLLIRHLESLSDELTAHKNAGRTVEEQDDRFYTCVTQNGLSHTECYYFPIEGSDACYLLEIHWSYDGVSRADGSQDTELQQLVASEAELLRSMARSFTVGSTDNAAALTLANGETVAARRYDGDGWYLYAPTDWTYSSLWTQWTAPDGREAHFTVNKATMSMKNTKAYYAEIGAWPFDTDMPAPLDYYYNLTGGYDAANGYAHEELYFIPMDESSSYVLFCYSVNGTTSEQDKLILRAMARSFTVDESVHASYTPSFAVDFENLSNEANFAAYLTLSKDGEALGGYSLLNSQNTPRLNSYLFVSTAAPETRGKMKLTLYLANNDASYFEFYEGTNTLGYFRADAAEYYKVSEDFAAGDGVGLYDEIRSWYDEAEFAEVLNAIEPIPDIGQTWEQAALGWLDAYEGVHLAVSSGSQYKYTWLKNAVEPADDITQFWRETEQIDEDTWCFYSKTAFVAENERALNYAMAGNTGSCTIAGAPDGAYEYTHCCAIRRTAEGWIGTMYGTGW